VSDTLSWQRLAALALPLLLLGALALRVWVFWTQLYVVFADETFQYLEQGHRLAFGTGVLPWEFQDGIRSWLLPGLLAGLMRLTSLIGDDPLLYLRAARFACAALSLVVVLIGFQLGRRHHGLAGGLIAGGLCAIWFDLVYFAPTVMTEVLAAHVGLLALWLGEDAERQTPRRLLLGGAALGLACCLRYQYGPALAAAVLLQHRLAWPRWRWLLLGAAAVVLPVGGVLDAVTWGSPFQSVWLNAMRNSVQGVSAGIGIDPAAFYLAYLSVALWPAPLLVSLAGLGARRAPALALAAVAALVMHMLIPHKEVRFIYLALAISPILIGLGIADALRIVAARCGARVIAWGVPVTLALAGLVSLHNATTWPLSLRWQAQRANVSAFLAAHEHPELCGLAVRDVHVFTGGGYTYLHRDVPVFFEDFTASLRLANATVPLRMAVMLRGQSVPQHPGASLAGAAGQYNMMIADAGNAEPGFSPVSCFEDATREGRVPLCLFGRPGGCS
jgi:hypothetical protein